MITDAGLKELAARTDWLRLTLNLTKVTDAGVREVQAVLPRTAIQH